MTDKAKKLTSEAKLTDNANVKAVDRTASSDLYLYWFDEVDFVRAKAQLVEAGRKVVSTQLTPCQVLKASGNKVVYATPEVWSRMCVRQGSWYRNSRRLGQYMVMSEGKLPETYDAFLDAEISQTNFKPDTLPTTSELVALVESSAYQDGKPEEWEAKTTMDAIMFKLLFSLTRFWKWGDNLKKHWITHRANHANFLARHFTAKVDGEDVPYSVSENAGICSSCVEYFNLIDDGSRKLVRACPGAVTFGGAKRDVFLDVKPVARQNAD